MSGLTGPPDPVTAPPLTIAAWQLLIGGGAATIGMLLFEGLPALHALSLPVWLAVAYHVLFAWLFLVRLDSEILDRKYRALRARLSFN